MASAGRMGRIVHVFSEIENILVELNRACPTVEFVQVDSSGARNEVISKLEKAEVLLGDSHILSDYPNYLPNLKWLQLTFAGVDAVIKSLAAPPKFIITRFGGVLGHYMAEYVIGQVIAREKDFLLMARNQEKRIWLQNVSCRSLHGLNLGILGIGEIGKELARVAKTFGMITWGMGRTPRNTPPANVDKYITPNSLEDLLCSCHYICNILPSTPSTRYLLSGDVLKKCMNNKPVFINVGRGDVIDEKSLVHALKEHWLSGAILDVFEKEPLSQDSELWGMDNVVITPHVSGWSFADQTARVFADNLELYEAKKRMNYIVDYSRGY